MITLGNYKEKTADFNFDLLPSKFKEGHKYITDYGDLYNDDAEIKEIIDLYLEQLNKATENKFLKEHIIVARVPKVEEKKVQEVKPEPKKAKVKPAKTPKSERNKKKVAEKKSKRETKKEKHSREVNAEQFIKDVEGNADLRNLTENQVIGIGLQFETNYRSYISQKRDEGHDTKKRLSPTPENLLRWMKHPGHFDLIGVDTFERIDPTADYKKEISKQKFWNNVYGIKV